MLSSGVRGSTFLPLLNVGCSLLILMYASRGLLLWVSTSLMKNGYLNELYVWLFCFAGVFCAADEAALGIAIRIL